MGLKLRVWGLGLRGTQLVGCTSKGFPKIEGTLFGGPNYKDYSIVGSILKTILFRETNVYSNDPQLA